MATTLIECRNEWDRAVDVHLIAGDRERGIGYCEGKPVLVGGGVIQPAASPGEKWIWTDRAGDGWLVTTCPGRDAYWAETTPKMGNGWRQY